MEVTCPHTPSTKDVQVQAVEDALVQATLFGYKDIAPDPQIPREDQGLGVNLHEVDTEGSLFRSLFHAITMDGWKPETARQPLENLATLKILLFT